MVRLRALEPEDAPAFVDADADGDALRAGWRVFAPRPLVAVEAWIAEQVGADHDGDRVRLGIDVGGVLVGTVATDRCDPVAGTFDYSVDVFASHRRHGYASDAVIVLLRWMFGERRYQKCTVGVKAFNDASLALHARLGFVEEGRIRRAHYAAGRHWDEIVLGMTVEEFAQLWGFPDPAGGPGRDGP